MGSKIKDLLICPIYANLPTELQARIEHTIWIRCQNQSLELRVLLSLT